MRDHMLGFPPVAAINPEKRVFDLGLGLGPARRHLEEFNRFIGGPEPTEFEREVDRFNGNCDPTLEYGLGEQDVNKMVDELSAYAEKMLDSSTKADPALWHFA